jgi:hypothetical protein
MLAELFGVRRRRGVRLRRELGPFLGHRPVMKPPAFAPTFRYQRRGIYSSLENSSSIGVPAQLCRGLRGWHGGSLRGARLYIAARLRLDYRDGMHRDLIRRSEQN